MTVTLPWAGLLVSVCDATEAVEALAGKAAIIDVKEPRRGPLGAADAAVAAAIASVVAERAPWTLACGELADGGAAEHVRAAAALLPGGAPPPRAAKAGPATLGLGAWRDHFAAFAAGLPEGVEAVAVAYADWAEAMSPAPGDLIAAAAEAGCRTLLIDTFDKSSCGVMQGESDLVAWIAQAKAAGMAVAVAGRLAIRELGRVAALGADVAAVRSAVCPAGRLDRVDRRLVAGAVAALAGRGGAPLPS